MGLAVLPLIGSIASTGLSMYGQGQQAKAARQAAEYNNLLAQREADNREKEASQGITRERANQRAALAEISNRLAGSGVQTGTGTPLAIIGETAGRFEVGIADAARAASIQAASMRAKGAMGLWEAGQVSAAARTQMFATGIAGLSGAVSKYQQGTYEGIKYGF